MSFYDPWHVMSFEALSSGRSDCFGLIPCYIRETPSVAIAMFNESRKGVEVMPLFIGITADMEITFPDKKGDSGGGGGPKRDDIKQEFVTNASMMNPELKHG